MDQQKAASKADEIIKLLDHLRREVEETKSYISRSDPSTAMRNQNDSNDELQNLVRKWSELAQAIAGR